MTKILLFSVRNESMFNMKKWKRRERDINLRFEVLTVLRVNINILWDVTSYSLVYTNVSEESSPSIFKEEQC
jgi:hypothetical protein